MTEFAPSPRAPIEVVRAQFRSIVGTHCREFFDALPNMVMALNASRQVVFANKAMLEFLGRIDVDELLGRRIGEVLGCVNAGLNVGGCGTSRHCRSCGAVAAILSAFDGVVANEECRLLRRVASELDGLDMHVTASPFLIGDERFVLFAITDITHESRRRSMERIFFHDVLNLAGGISGLSEMLHELVPDGLKHEFGILRAATDALVEEVMAQRDMVAAENNELKLTFSQVGSLEILQRLRNLYAHSSVAQGRSIVLAPGAADLCVTTDARLVQRVLGNMLKNALEALPQGGIALLTCRDEGSQAVFSVHNAGVIPRDVQDSIFHRSFSTKGSGRGMGTYSMLLLAERFLGGSVGYRSSESEGTVFFLRIPKTPEQCTLTSSPS